MFNILLTPATSSYNIPLYLQKVGHLEPVVFPHYIAKPKSINVKKKKKINVNNFDVIFLAISLHKISGNV